MGCNASTAMTGKQPQRKRAGASSKLKRANKPPKDYASDPKYQAFISCGATGNLTDPKSMRIGKDQVRIVLETVQINCQGDGSGFAEFCIMDRDFRDYVRFKDFCKFVKNHKKGKPYKDTDSSLSTSEGYVDMCRDMWMQFDMQRQCKVPISQALAYVIQHMQVENEEKLKADVLLEINANSVDQEITFQQFGRCYAKFFPR